MVIALAGRRIDAPDTKVKSFPLENVEKVKAAIKDYFITSKPKAIVCSAACGADLIALKVAGEMSVDRTMILPFSPDVFKETSVIDRPGNWGEIFDEIYNEMRGKEKVVVLNYNVNAPGVYEQTNIDILDEAENILRTTLSMEQQSDVITALVVWNGQSREGNDATAHFLQEAIRRNYTAKQINTR